MRAAILRARFRLLNVDLADLVRDDGPVRVAGFEEDGVDIANRERRLQHSDAGALAHRDDLGAVGVVRLEGDVVEEVVGRRPHRARDDCDPWPAATAFATESAARSIRSPLPRLVPPNLATTRIRSPRY